MEVNIDERCRNCMSADPDPNVIARETFIHYFWECSYSSTILNAFRSKYLSNVNVDDFKNLVFLGTDPDAEYCIFYRLLSVLLLYEIWDCGKERRFN
jgi:hypothetical protein